MKNKNNINIRVAPIDNSMHTYILNSNETLNIIVKGPEKHMNYFEEATNAILLRYKELSLKYSDIDINKYISVVTDPEKLNEYIETLEKRKQQKIDTENLTEKILSNLDVDKVKVKKLKI